MSDDQTDRTRARRSLVVAMRVHGFTYAEIGRAFGFTRERARQLEAIALRKAKGESQIYAREVATMGGLLASKVDGEFSPAQDLEKLVYAVTRKCAPLAIDTLLQISTHPPHKGETQ